MKTILLIGANSTIGHAIARQIAEKQENQIRFFLVGRDPERLESHATDLKVRGATQVETFVADLTNHQIHCNYFQKAIDLYGFIDEIYITHGLLGDQNKAKTDLSLAIEIAKINYLSIVAISTLLVQYGEQKKIGNIVIFSSVAGDRGRKSNYIYGSTMAGKTALISGLRVQLEQHNIHVMTVKPGLVNTRMTLDFKKGLLWTTPEKVANDVIRNLKKKSNICYTPGFWRMIMLIIVHIPEGVFKKLKF